MSYNIISCRGFTETQGSWIASLPCMKARIGLVILFFVIAMIRKWGGEMMGISFNFLFALILSLIPYVIVIIIFGSFKIAFVIGIIGGLIGGYGGGIFFGDDGGFE